MAPARGNQNAAVHGLHSEARIRPLARAHRRRVLRQFGLRASELSPIGKAYVDQVVRLKAKIDLIDAYIGEHGLIRPDGSLQPALALYGTLENSLRLGITRLENHLHDRAGTPGDALAKHLDEHYSGS